MKTWPEQPLAPQGYHMFIFSIQPTSFSNFCQSQNFDTFQGTNKHIPPFEKRKSHRLKSAFPGAVGGGLVSSLEGYYFNPYKV